MIFEEGFRKEENVVYKKVRSSYPKNFILLHAESGCRNIGLYSSGKTSAIHSEKLGLYVKENRLVNGRLVFRHRYNFYHLYWINEYGGHWIVSNQFSFSKI